MHTDNNESQGTILYLETVRISQKIEVRWAGDETGVRYVVMSIPYEEKGREVVDLLYRGRYLHIRPVREAGLYPEDFKGEKHWTAYLID